MAYEVAYPAGEQSQESMGSSDKNAERDGQDQYGNESMLDQHGFGGGAVLCSYRDSDPFADAADEARTYCDNPGNPFRSAQTIVDKVPQQQKLEELFDKLRDEQGGTPSLDLCDLGASVILLQRFGG